MRRPTQPTRMLEDSESDDFLDTDDEVDEFENGMQIDQEEDEEEDGVAQWQPDDWDAADEDDEDSEDDDESALKRNLSNMPLSTLAKARSKMSKVSKYQKGESSKSATAASTSAGDEYERKRTRIESRDSKHAPTAMSAKKQVSRLRQVVDLPKIERRDPRFSSVSAGHVDAHLHQKSYGFISQMYKDELEQIKQSLATAAKAERSCAQKDKAAWAEERANLERRLVQMKTKIDRSQREQRDRETLSAAKKEEREKRKSGKGAWHMKKGAQRDLLLKSRFEALEANGGKMAVKKALDKKRKKVASKEKKSRPRL